MSHSSGGILALHGQALDELLVPARDQRRAVGDAPRQRIGFGFDLVVGDDAVDQALAVSLVGVEHAAFEQDFQRHGATDQRQQAGEFAIGHGQPQLVDRHAETARGAADAHVAHRGDFQAAADAGAFDQRHGRVAALRDGLHRAVDQLTVPLGLSRVGALGGEFGDVGAGGKGLAAGAAQHDAAQCVIARRAGAWSRPGLPTSRGSVR